VEPVCLISHSKHQILNQAKDARLCVWPSVPRQKNGFDCGAYVCKFAEQFTRAHVARKVSLQAL